MKTETELQTFIGTLDADRLAQACFPLTGHFHCPKSFLYTIASDSGTEWGPDRVYAFNHAPTSKPDGLMAEAFKTWNAEARRVCIARGFVTTTPGTDILSINVERLRPFGESEVIQ